MLNFRVFPGACGGTGGMQGCGDAERSCIAASKTIMTESNVVFFYNDVLASG
jgi:hypothetical protein